MEKIKIVVVEDLEEVAEGLAEFIKADERLRLLGTYRTAEAAVLEIPILKPDIAVMDINLPGMSGIECIKQVKKAGLNTQFMMFTVYDNDEQVFEALKAGASGYMLKRASPREIVDGIKELYNGGSPMSATIARKLVTLFRGEHHHQHQLSSLTSRENEVLNLLAKGLLYKEIAEQLGISFHTVRQHIAKIYEKLHVQNRTEAVNRMYGHS